MNVKLASINLQVADPERSRGFYVDALGMVEDVERSHRPSFIYLRSDGCDLTLAMALEADGAEPSRTMELGFEVDDLAAMRARLDALGHRDVRPQSMGWGEALELHDADGHRVVIYSLARVGEPTAR